MTYPKSGARKCSIEHNEQRDGGTLAPKEETTRKFQTLLKATGSTLGAWSNRGKQQQQQQQRQPKGNFDCISLGLLKRQYVLANAV